jgi:multidrug efflux pump subunit AcrA (membrane-fusion protein)
LDGGKTIKLDMSLTDQIASVPVEKKNLKVDIKAPCRVSASAMVSSAGAAPVLFFETSDISDAYSDFQRNKSQLEKSEKQVARLKALVEHEAAAGKDLSDAQSDLDQLKTSLAQSESKLRLSGLSVDDIVQLEAGNVLVVADVPESQLRSVSSGGTAQVVFNAYPNEPCIGRVMGISDIIDPNTRTVKVEFKLSNAKSRLLAGMYGQVLFGVAEQNAATVPVSSIFTAQGQSFLFVEKERGMFERRQVLVGLQGSDWVEVLEGVSDSEKVVSKGAMLLKGLSFGY